MDFAARDELVREMMTWDNQRIISRLKTQLAKNARELAHDPSVVDRDVTTQERAMIAQNAPVEVQRVMDSTVTALVRQDLDPMLHALFLRRFPWFQRIHKEASNGLVHAFNQITAPGSLADTSLTITELGNVQDDTATYSRQTTPIAVFANRRGVSLKQQFAVAQGGAPYNPEAEELAAGVTLLTRAIQRLMFGGNADSATSASATAEYGAYNANGFSGLRRVLGSLGAFSGNNAIAVDLGAASIVQAVNSAVQQIVDNGGEPSVVVMSAKSLMAHENEQTQFERIVDTRVEFVPGVQVASMNTVAGVLPIAVVPGDSIGSYNRIVDSVLVEDIYVLDEAHLTAPWLGSDMLTTLEIPIGANAQLSRLFIQYAMYGLAVKAPPFCAKVRRPI